jgi:hypothetical protein
MLGIFLMTLGAWGEGPVPLSSGGEDSVASGSIYESFPSYGVRLQML